MVNITMETRACVFLPFASPAVEEAGPLKAGLLAAHPEDRGDSHHQHHHVLEQEQAQLRTAAAVHLRRTGNEVTGHDRPSPSTPLRIPDGH